MADSVSVITSVKDARVLQNLYLWNILLNLVIVSIHTNILSMLQYSWSIETVYNSVFISQLALSLDLL